MTTVQQFIDFHKECNIIIHSIRMNIDYAERLLDFIIPLKEDDKDCITQFQPLTQEHFATLNKTAKQLSSLSDRFNNKLSYLKKFIDEVDSTNNHDNNNDNNHEKIC